MPIPAGFAKRLEDLGAAIKFRHARTIVVSVPTQLTPVPHSVEMTAAVMPETRRAVDALLETLLVGEQDLVIEVSKYTGEVPELISLT